MDDCELDGSWTSPEASCKLPVLDEDAAGELPPWRTQNQAEQPGTPAWSRGTVSRTMSPSGRTESPGGIGGWRERDEDRKEEHTEAVAARAPQESAARSPSPQGSAPKPIPAKFVMEGEFAHEGAHGTSGSSFSSSYHGSGFAALVPHTVTLDIPLVCLVKTYSAYSPRVGGKDNTSTPRRHNVRHAEGTAQQPPSPPTASTASPLGLPAVPHSSVSLSPSPKGPSATPLSRLPGISCPGSNPQRIAPWGEVIPSWVACGGGGKQHKRPPLQETSLASQIRVVSDAFGGGWGGEVLARCASPELPRGGGGDAFGGKGMGGQSHLVQRLKLLR